MYHVGLCVLNVLFNLFPQGKGHCSERTGGGVQARRDYWSQEPSSVQGSFEGLRVSLGEGQCDGTEPPWLKVAWCLYGKRLCLPETKAFRWAMQTLGTLAAGGGEAHTQRVRLSQKRGLSLSASLEECPDPGPHLEDVVPRLHVGYVNPLAVDVRVVCVIAAWAQALGKGTGAEVRVLCAPQCHPMPTSAAWGLLRLCFVLILAQGSCSEWVCPFLSPLAEWTRETIDITARGRDGMREDTWERWMEERTERQVWSMDTVWMLGQTDRKTDVGGQLGKWNIVPSRLGWNIPFFLRADTPWECYRKGLGVGAVPERPCGGLRPGEETCALAEPSTSSLGSAHLQLGPASLACLSRPTCV